MSEDPIASLSTAINALQGWLEEAGIPYTLIGGIAVSILSNPRATQDVDAVIWLAQEKWPEAIQGAAAHGLLPRISQPLEFAMRARMLLLKHELTGIGLDISLGALEFEREMIQRSAPLSKGGITALVPTIEDLIVTKIVAHRQKDLSDIEALLSVGKRLDIPRIRSLATQFAEATDDPEILSNLEALLRKRKN